MGTGFWYQRKVARMEVMKYKSNKTGFLGLIFFLGSMKFVSDGLNEYGAYPDLAIGQIVLGGLFAIIGAAMFIDGFRPAKKSGSKKDQEKENI